MDKNKFKIEYKYDKVTPNVFYQVDGNGGEDINWRNINGSPCVNVSIADYNDWISGLTAIPPAGIYNITFISETIVEISTANSLNLLSPSVDTEQIEIYPGEYNNHIIMGLRFLLADSVFTGNKFQVAVGAVWLDNEGRNIKGTVFDPITSGTLPSEEKIFKVTNVSGKNLKKVYATVLNSSFVKQYQSVYDVDAVVPSRMITYAERIALSSIDDLATDQIVRLTAVDTPQPYRVVVSGISSVSDYSDTYFPFSNQGGLLNSSDYCKGWRVPYSSDLWTFESTRHYSITEENTVWIRYDFGRGNSVQFNRIGIASDRVQTLMLQVSNEEVDDPVDWEDMCSINMAAIGTDAYLSQGYIDTCDCGCNIYRFVGGTYDFAVKYKNFSNLKSYRHWRLSLSAITYGSWIFYPSDYLTRIARVEFIQIPDTLAIPYRDRPFELIDRSENIQPVFSSDDEGMNIHFANKTDEIIDILVDGIGYDIIDTSNDKTYIGGIEIPYMDGITYRFADLTPVGGLEFVINNEILENDYCTVWASQGSNIFQIRRSSGEGWSYKTPLFLTGSGDTEEGLMDNGDYDYLSIRANPTKDIKIPENNPIEGFLYVYGESDNEYEDSLIVKEYTVENEGNREGTIRLVIDNLPYKGEEIRFLLKSIDGLEINEAHFGLGETGSPDFQKMPQKVQVTFSDNTYLSLSGATQQWTDWVGFPTNGDSIYVFSYSGTKIGNYPTVESGEVSYFSDEVYIADMNSFTDYEEFATNFDVIQIEVRSKYKCSKVLGLSAVVNKGIKDLQIKTTIISSEISSVLQDFGISWEEIS